MRLTRRDFIKTTAAGSAGLMVLGHAGNAYAFSWTTPLQKFIQPLQGLGATGIPTLTPDNVTYGAGVDYYKIQLGAFRQQLHPSLPATGTQLYGYAALGGTHRHLGGVIVASKGRPVRINLTNNLPAAHILPFDGTIPMPDSLRQDRTAVHLHGGLVPWASDGGPFHWIGNPANGAAVGSSLLGTGAWLKDNVGSPTHDYWYPNNQSARLMWYHDHAIGITRTNAYAGAATGYLIYEAGVETSLGLGGPGTPLIFQDKVFWDPIVDPGYSAIITGALPGDLWYPYLYEKARWKVSNAKKALPPPTPSCIPEFFGDTMLVNGTAYPYVQVTREKLRFRLLNACNARFLSLRFVMEDPLVPGEPQMVKGLPVAAPVAVWQIGTEGGFLPQAVQLFTNAGLPGPGAPLPPDPPFLVTTAERPDIIVDFSLVPAGSNVLLYNDAPAPYPAGSPLYDWFLGSNKTPAPTTAGNGPNTRTLMQFRVVAAPPSNLVQVPNLTGVVPVLPTVPDALNGGLMLDAIPAGSPFAGYLVLPNTQELTLNETFDANGRLIQLLGTTAPVVGGGFGTPYIGATPQTAQYGTIQIWNIYNLTADAHPMHFHLFNVMVLKRRPFNVANFTGIPAWTGLAVGPDANETGWKETVRMMPGTCTTVAILVENPLPTGYVDVLQTAGGSVRCNLPMSPRTGGHEYVWHCHILEHEEHDMMHPLVAS